MLSPTGSALGQIPIFVSIVPQKYLVQQIGKELVNVHVMVQPGSVPHTYEPKPRQMMAITKTALYLAIGVEFERVWLKKITAANPQMKVVYTDQGIEKTPMTIGSYHVEKDNKAGTPENNKKAMHHNEPQNTNHRHQHQGLDPHIWLSPPLVKVQAQTILTALIALDPANANSYRANFQQFIFKVDQLDTHLRKIFADKKGLPFMVFHPAWGYFAQAYGLKQIPIEIEGKVPKPARLKNLIEYARAKGIQIIFAQPQLSTKSAGLVAKAINGQVVLADPLAENWFDNLNTIAEKFNAVLK